MRSAYFRIMLLAFCGAAAAVHAQINPANQIRWPVTCNAPNEVYVPSTNQCVVNGTAANPAGTNQQMQWNCGGSFCGASGVTTPDGNSLNVNGAMDVGGAIYGHSGYSGAAQVTGMGNSIMQGCCAQTAGTDQISYMATRNPAITAHTNLGVGGQTSNQIGTRTGAFTTNITFPGGIIPTTGNTATVTFTNGFEPCYNAGPGLQGPAISGSVNGIVGTCVDNGSHIYTWTTTGSGGGGALTTGRWLALPLAGCVVFDSGRNDDLTQPQAIISKVQAIAQSINAQTGCWLWETIPNEANNPNEQKGGVIYTNILLVNNTLMATFGPAHWLDLRGLLISKYNPADPKDVADFNHDAPPFSLKSQDTTTALTSPISDTSTCAFTVGSTPAPYTVYSIDAEYILVSGADGAYTCTRGYYIGGAATHLNGATVKRYDSLHPGASDQSSTNTNCGGLGGYSCVADVLNTWWTPQQTAYAQFAGAPQALGLGTGTVGSGNNGTLYTYTAPSLFSGDSNQWYSLNYLNATTASYAGFNMWNITPATATLNQSSSLINFQGNEWDQVSNTSKQAGVYLQQLTSRQPSSGTITAYSASGLGFVTLTINPALTAAWTADQRLTFSGFTGGLAPLNGVTLPIYGTPNPTSTTVLVQTPLVTGSGSDSGTATSVYTFNLAEGPNNLPSGGTFSTDFGNASAPLILPPTGMQIGHGGQWGIPPFLDKYNIFTFSNQFNATTAFDNTVSIFPVGATPPGSNYQSAALGFFGSLNNGSSQVIGGVNISFIPSAGTGVAGYLRLAGTGSLTGGSGIDMTGNSLGVKFPTAGVQFGNSGQMVTALPVKYSQSLTPAAVAASTCAEQVFSVTGLAITQAVTIPNPPAPLSHVWIGSARVSTTNFLAIQFCGDATGGTPPSGTWLFTAD